MKLKVALVSFWIRLQMPCDRCLGSMGIWPSGKYREVPSAHRLLKERIAGPDIVGDIGDMDADEIIAVLFLNGQGIVEVEGGGAVDGERGEMGEVDSAGILKEFLLAALQDRFGLLAGGQRKTHGDILAQQGQIFVFAPDAGLDQDMERDRGD